MSITTPYYYLRAHSGASTPNDEGSAGATDLSGGTISLVDRGGADGYVWRFSGSASSATFTAIDSDQDNDGIWVAPTDLPIVIALRMVIQTASSDAFPRHVVFSYDSDVSYGSGWGKNNDNSVQRTVVPSGDNTSIGNQFGGANLKTVVVKLTPGTSGNPDTCRIWVQTSGRSGSTPDYVSTGATYSQFTMAFDRVIVTPATSGVLDIARLALYAPENISDADCAALADNFDATISPSSGVLDEDFFPASAVGAVKTLPIVSVW